MKKFEVTITRTGSIIVEAETADEAFDKVFEMTTADIDKSADGNLTGWEPSDVEEVECMKTLMEMLIDAGYPKEDMYHHYSDLYIFVTPLTKKIVDKWYKERGLNREWHCPIFKDQITGRPMYDCAFQWYENQK